MEVKVKDSEKFNLHHNKHLLCFAIVVYRELFYETKAFLSLMNCLDESDIQCEIYVYDNTDLTEWNVQQQNSRWNDTLHYHRDKTNAGISKAYNYMASQARENGSQWIVFMDQDTSLPLSAIDKYINAVHKSPDLPVKSPVLLVEGHIFSPFKVFLKRSITIKKVTPGFLPLKNYGIVNSGMIVNLDFFFKIGGYNECVKLDFADFLFIERVKKKVRLIEILDFSCNHEFSNNETNVNKVLVRYAIFITDLMNCPKPTFKDKLGYFIVGLLHATKLTIKFKTLKFCTVWIKGFR